LLRSNHLLWSLCAHSDMLAKVVLAPRSRNFSWWGAWLCENPDQVVIAPQRWFNDPGIDTRDLLPEGWIRL